MNPQLVWIGAFFINIASGLQVIQSLLQKEYIRLTTIVSLMLAYSAGFLVRMKLYTSAIIITVILTLKQEVHTFVEGVAQAKS